MRGKLHHRVYKTRTDYRGEELFVPVAMHWWVDPKPPIRFTNHSCDPNAGFKTPRRVYARRNIKKGEEVTIDYSTIEYFEPWSMRCTCGSRVCRKVVCSVQFLPPKRFKEYLPYIPKFLQKIHRQAKKSAKM